MRGFFLSASALFFALPALAGEPNSFRQAEPFMATPAFAPHICEMQCTGDAQCRSWNFIPDPRPNVPGRCELNSTVGQLFPHPVAQSGLAQGVTPRDSSRLIAAGSRTTRIGQMAAPRPAPQPVIAASTARVPQPQRGAIPAPVTRQVQLPARPGPSVQFAPRPSMPAPSVQAVPQAQAAPVPRPQNQPVLIPGAQIARPAPQAPQTPVSQAAAFRRPVPAAPQMPVPPRAAMPAAMANAAAAPAPIRPQAPQRPALSMEETLYGSLYDDARPKVEQKLPLYSEAQRPASDEPVVTTRAVPVTEVEETAFPLAGGPN